MKEFGVIIQYTNTPSGDKIGYIENPKFSSVFFLSNSSSRSPNVDQFKSGMVVGFSPISSSSSLGKWEANEVFLVDVKKDLAQLVDLYLRSFLDPHLKECFPEYIKGLYHEVKRLLIRIQNDESIEVYFKHFISVLKNYLSAHKTISKFKAVEILKIGNSLFPRFHIEFSSVISQAITAEDHFYLWDKSLTQVLPIKYLINTEAVLDEGSFIAIAQKANPDDLVNLFIFQIESFLGEDFIQAEKIKVVFQHAKKRLGSRYERFLESVTYQLSGDLAFEFWKEELINNCPIEVVLNEWSLDKTDLTQQIFIRFKISEKELLSKMLHDKLVANYDHKIVSLKNLKFFYSLIQQNFSPEFQFELAESFLPTLNLEDRIQIWYHGFEENLPINAIIEKYSYYGPDSYVLVFDKANKDEIINFVRAILYEQIEELTDIERFLCIADFQQFSILKGTQLDPVIAKDFYDLCSPYLKLKLWLIDFLPFLDFGLFKPHIITLSTAEQHDFFKKVMNYIHQGKYSISVEELTSLNLIDYQLAKQLEKIDGQKLDYSLSIVLDILQTLSHENNLKTPFELKKRLFEIVLNQIQGPEDVLEIKGFFDECKGRAIMHKVEKKDSQGNVEIEHVVIRKEELKPINHLICDGRKAFEKDSEKRSIEKNSGKEFWWCANQICFLPCRNFKDPVNWRNYAIQDFLNILNIQYSESDLEIYLSMINKVNRFLEHLKCRTCKHVLYPSKQSNYAFYGVNHFHCQNEHCEEKGREIYLTHCLNGKCDSTIDSRDCVRCVPEGYDQKSCGWYVCNDCHACCSSEKLWGRKYVAEEVNKIVYTCHSQGHKDQGIISCNKCGHSMDIYEPKVEEFNRILSWFIENRVTSDQVVNSGKSKFDKWWFRLKAKDSNTDAFFEKVKHYKRIGFNVPDLEVGKDHFLISEPINFSSQKTNEIECNHCGNRVDFNEFPEKRVIMRGYYETANL
jgi:hypothetical protein